MAQGQKNATVINENSLTACRVGEVLHNHDQEGHVRYDNNGIDAKSGKGPIAKPLFPFLKYTPIVGEQVIILNLPNTNSSDEHRPQSFYLPVVNIFNGVNHNIYSNYESEDSDKGKYFKEKNKITPLFPLEGDFILEGRFGNSIRMGGSADPDKIGDTITHPTQNKKEGNNLHTKIPWSNNKNTTSDPIIIIKNEQKQSLLDSGKSYIENIDTDGSSIYLTSTQNISNLNDIIPKDVFPPKSMNSYATKRKLLTSEDYRDLDTSLYTDEDISDNIGGDLEYSVYENKVSNPRAEDQFNLDNAEGSDIYQAGLVVQVNPTGSDGKTYDEGLLLLDEILKEQNDISEDSYIQSFVGDGEDINPYYSIDELKQLEKEWESTYTFIPEDYDELETITYIDPTTNLPYEWADPKAVIGQWHDGSNFTAYHATKSTSHPNNPIRSEQHFKNIQNVFNNFLKPLGRRYGLGSFLISSIYRPWLTNGSAHTGGLAADIVGNTINVCDIFDFFYDKFGGNSPMRQLIFEFPGEGSEHIHVAYGSPRSGGSNFKASSRISTWASFLGVAKFQSYEDYDNINPDIINLYSKYYKPNSGRPIQPSPSNETINTNIYTDLSTM
jgi:hypothetical protein